MKKKELEIKLQQIPPLEDPKSSLEQYSTPPAIAADVLFTAYAMGDVQGKRVLDLGCGNGIFCIGAKLLGASESIGVDVDPAALEQARKNAVKQGVEVDFEQGDVAEMGLEADTVIQNPPFGAQRREADRPFLRKAVRSSEVVYTMHLEKTLGFLQEYIGQLGGEITLQKTYKFNIPHTFTFHSEKAREVEVLLLRIESGEK